MEEARTNPEEILNRIHLEEEKKERGHLKIFFGYAAGVGKTYAMLEAAREARLRNIDVVVGYVEPHARPQTLKLLAGLEVIPPMELLCGDLRLHEFDLDGALARKPQLILVDELAHTNGKGCRHLKRYQDVKELLSHGISVYTTLNVQHIESLNDLVASITGIMVRERIPDSVFDQAEQVELVDIEPEDLILRLNEGKVYARKQAQRALGNFFTPQNLTALREIALRRCADRVNKAAEQSGSMKAGRTAGEHILVCLSSSPTNARIIRTAARMASAFKGDFTALFVETPGDKDMSRENMEKLTQNMHLARQLGAAVETIGGEDIAFQISEFARLFGVTKLVLGRSNGQKQLFGPLPLTERIIQLSPNLDIYIIPDQNTPVYRSARPHSGSQRLSASDWAKGVLILGAATAVSVLFYELGFSEANIVMVYILGVLFTAVSIPNRVFSLVSSTVSVLLFNLLFTEPRFTLHTYSLAHAATFPIMLIDAFLVSSLAVRMKQQAVQSAKTAYRTKILFDTNQLIGSGKNSGDIISVTCNQLAKLLDRDVVFYRTKGEALEKPLLFPEDARQPLETYTAVNEYATALWVCRNNRHAGATTGTLGNAKCLYLSVRVGQNVYGVVGIAVGKLPLDTFENSIVLSILGECALALQNEAVSRGR